MPKKQYKTPIGLAKYASKIKGKKVSASQGGAPVKDGDISINTESPEKLEKANIEPRTTVAVKKMSREIGPEESSVSGGLSEMKYNLARVKKAYEKAVKSGDKEKIKYYAKGYNRLLKKAKGYAKKNYKTLIKSEKVRKKYKPVLNRAMSIDEAIQGLEND